MTPERFQRLRWTLDRKQPDLTVLTDQVHKPHNLAAVLRTCDAVGIMNAHVVLDSTTYRPQPGTSLGSERWVTVESHERIEPAIQKLRDGGHQVLAAHFSPQAVDFRSLDYTRPTALLLGAEKHGVSKSAATDSDVHIVIPMMGMVASFNVSVAAAIVLAEAQRQRQNAGMYDRVQLEPDHYNAMLFRWAHPVLAAYCDRHQLPYPELSEDGDIRDLADWRNQTGQRAGLDRSLGNP